MLLFHFLIFEQLFFNRHGDSSWEQFSKNRDSDRDEINEEQPQKSSSVGVGYLEP